MVLMRYEMPGVKCMLNRRERLIVSLGTVLAAAGLYYRGILQFFPAFAAAAAVHELSHLLALRLLGLRVDAVSPEPGGLCIRYEGECSPTGHAAAAAAGPLGGCLYACAALLAARSLGMDWLRLSGQISLFFSGFNLLPILPLDGGRMFLILCCAALGEEPGGRFCRVLGDVLLAGMLFAGVLLAARKKITAPLSAGIWLLLLQNDRQPLVKKGEIV